MSRRAQRSQWLDTHKRPNGLINRGLANVSIINGFRSEAFGPLRLKSQAFQTTIYR